MVKKSDFEYIDRKAKKQRRLLAGEPPEDTTSVESLSITISLTAQAEIDDYERRALSLNRQKADADEKLRPKREERDRRLKDAARAVEMRREGLSQLAIATAAIHKLKWSDGSTKSFWKSLPLKLRISPDRAKQIIFG